MVFSLNFTCPICLEYVKSTGRTLCCGQGICKECFRKCDEASETCPLCRAPSQVPDTEHMARIIRLKDKSDPVSQILIGHAYRDGEYGFEQNIERAMECYRLSAEYGYAPALNHLGFIYQNGLQGVEVDMKKALKLFRQSALQHNVEARFHIGYAYYHGTGVKLDIKKALKYFVLAADECHDEAQFACGRIYEKGHDGIERDRHKALEYYTSAAAHGHGEAQDAAHVLLNNWYSEVL